MNRTDTLIGLLSLTGVILIASFTYYFLKEPTVETTMTIQEVADHSPIRKKEAAVHLAHSNPSSKPTPATIDSHTQISSEGLLNALHVQGTASSTPLTASLVASNSSSTISTPSNSETEPLLEDVHFDFDRGGLPHEAKSLLTEHAKVLQGSDWGILIQGHTDNRGSTKHNFRLGLRRAQTVKDYLVSLGISPSRIDVVSLGEYAPVCMNANEECRRKNRRVHFSLTKLEPLQQTLEANVPATSTPSESSPSVIAQDPEQSPSSSTTLQTQTDMTVEHEETDESVSQNVHSTFNDLEPIPDHGEETSSQEILTSSGPPLPGDRQILEEESVEVPNLPTAAISQSDGIRFFPVSK